MFDTPAAKGQRNQNRDHRKNQRVTQLRLNFALQKHGGDADANVAERLAFALDRKINVIDPRRAEHRP